MKWQIQNLLNFIFQVFGVTFCLGLSKKRSNGLLWWWYFQNFVSVSRKLSISFSFSFNFYFTCCLICFFCIKRFFELLKILFSVSIFWIFPLVNILTGFIKILEYSSLFVKYLKLKFSDTFFRVTATGLEPRTT